MATTTAAPSGRDYNAIFEANAGDSGLRQGGVSDRTRDRLAREEHARLHRQGWTPATVVNLHPFPLMVNLGELGVLRVTAAAADGTPAVLRITDYRFSMRDLGDGNFVPVSVLPSELAREIDREYKDTGGVFWFPGDRDPDDAEVSAARDQQRRWWRLIYQRAVDSWSRYHQHKMITDRQRDAARALFASGEIAQLPEWVTITRAQSDRMECPMCGEDIKRNAKICHFCRTRLDGGDEGASAADSNEPTRPTAQKVQSWQRAYERGQEAVAKGASATAAQVEAARELAALGKIDVPEWAL